MNTNKKAFFVAIVFLTLLCFAAAVFGAPPNFMETAQKATDAPQKHVYHEQVYQAAAKAYFAKKPLLIVFGADWCFPCKQLHKALETPKFEKMLEEKYIVLYLDIEGKNKKWIHDHFGELNPKTGKVELKFNIPHMEVIDTRKEKTVKEFTGYSKKLEQTIFDGLRNVTLEE